MKKRVLPFLWAMLCTFLYYSCKKDIAKNSDQSVVESGEQCVFALRGAKQGGTSIFDPTYLVAPHAQLKTLGEGFSFTEGPAVDKRGNVFFTDQPNDKIYKWSANTGAITTFLTGTGRANGTFFDKKGNLIACADMYGELRKIFPDGSHEVLINNYNGKLLNGPNDVWINPKNGGMYITDPIFPRGYWDPGDPRQQPWEPTRSEQAATGKGGHVYYLAPGSQQLVRVTTMPEWDADSWPNGVVGTPDGKKLYVNKWYYDNMGGTWVFDVKHDGTLHNMKKFSDMGGDGMAMDERGNVYIANGLGITAFDPEGNKIFNVPTGSGATNVVFGGPNEKTLFITAIDKIFSLKMNVRGVEKFNGYAGWHGHGHGHGGHH
ncbi:SMP-30/gluconolactonase/LRE family protein [Terrimonas alba]|uniref:SMP-30/gluconolactonase/LRE family protein n=1 Tax=Terrimonas alba TaxID=3349636 RepID=UPI0035F4F1D9